MKLQSLGMPLSLMASRHTLVLVEGGMGQAVNMGVTVLAKCSI